MGGGRTVETARRAAAIRAGDEIRWLLREMRRPHYRDYALPNTGILVREGGRQRRVTHITSPDEYYLVRDENPISRVWQDFGRFDVDYIEYVESHARPFLVKFEGTELQPGARKRYTEEEIIALFGKQVARFAKAAMSGFNNVLTKRVAVAIGLMNGVEDEHTYEDGEPEEASWVIEEIMLSNGSHNQVAGSMYAKDLRTKTWHPIDFYTFQQWGSLTEMGAGYGGSMDETGWFKGTRSQAEAVIELFNLCAHSPGIGVRVHTSKSRAPSVYAYRHFVNDVRIRCRDNTDECVRASFANALCLLDGASDGVAWWNNQARSDRRDLISRGYRKSIRSVRHLTRAVESSVPGVTLRHVHDENGRLSSPSLSFFTSQKKKGIFVVTMVGSREVLHSICVDTRASPGTIYDSSEPFAMRLSKEALKLCVGDSESLYTCNDLREVVRYMPKKIPGEGKRKRPSASARRAAKQAQGAGPSR